MTIQAINAASVSNKNAYKNMTAPKGLQQPETKPETKENTSSSKALMNYFIGAQNVPSFKGYPCSTGAFVVKQINDVPCACCGAEMMNAKEQNDFVSKATTLKGGDLAELFSTNLDKIRRNERPVAREIMERASKYPEDGIAQLVNREDMDPNRLFKKENAIVLDNIDKKAKELYGEKNKVSSLVERKKANLDNKFSRNQFLDELQKVSTDHQILDEAIEFPLELRGVSKVVTKVQNSDKTGIARRLIATAVMTTEHIHPKSQGGPNDTSNYMGECAECNNNRGSENLNQYWQEVYPNMPHSVQEYADYITDKIVKGEMGVKYEDHMIDLEKAVERESNGVIDLKVLNPEEIDKMRQEKGYDAPKPLPEPEPKDKPGDVKKPGSARKPGGSRKPNRKPNRK